MTNSDCLKSVLECISCHSLVCMHQINWFTNVCDRCLYLLKPNKFIDPKRCIFCLHTLVVDNNCSTECVKCHRYICGQYECVQQKNRYNVCRRCKCKSKSSSTTTMSKTDSTVTMTTTTTTPKSDHTLTGTKLNIDSKTKFTLTREGLEWLSDHQRQVDMDNDDENENENLATMIWFLTMFVRKTVSQESYKSSLQMRKDNLTSTVKSIGTQMHQQFLLLATQALFRCFLMIENHS